MLNVASAFMWRPALWAPSGAENWVLNATLLTGRHWLAPPCLLDATAIYAEIDFGDKRQGPGKVKINLEGAAVTGASNGLPRAGRGRLVMWRSKSCLPRWRLPREPEAT
jgi:hypothetical protein